MKRFFVVALLLFLPLFFFVPSIHAQKRQPVITELPMNQTVNKDYFATGDSVRVMGTVNGDTYAAGGNVDVSGTVNGDLLVAGGNIVITGVVKNDIRVAGGNITLSGAKVGGNITVVGGQIIFDKQTTIDGSVTGAGGNFTFYGPVKKGMTIAGGQVTVANGVGGDLLAGVGNLSLADGASVDGSLTYWSDSKAQISQGASVSGKISQEIPVRHEKEPQKAAAGLVGLFFFLKFTDTLMLLIIGILMTLLLPNYMAEASEFMESKFWVALLIGLVGVVVTPILLVLLMLSVVGIPLALFLFVVYFFLMWFVRIFPILAIGKFAISKLGNNTASRPWAYVAGLVIYIILSIIPIVSSLTDIAVLLTGYGTFLAMKKNYYTTLRTKKLI